MSTHRRRSRSASPPRSPLARRFSTDTFNRAAFQPARKPPNSIQERRRKDNLTIRTRELPISNCSASPQGRTPCSTCPNSPVSAARPSSALELPLSAFLRRRGRAPGDGFDAAFEDDGYQSDGVSECGSEVSDAGQCNQCPICCTREQLIERNSSHGYPRYMRPRPDWHSIDWPAVKMAIWIILVVIFLRGFIPACQAFGRRLDSEEGLFAFGHWA